MRALWTANPDDLLIGRIFAKSLLALQTFMGINKHFTFLIEDSVSKRHHEEALKIVEQLRSKHAYTKLNGPLVYFKFAGMANYMSLNELINQVRREILKAGPLSPSTFQLKLLLGEIYMQIEAYQQIWQELEPVEKALANGKYKEIPHGWLLQT